MRQFYAFLYHLDLSSLYTKILRIHPYNIRVTLPSQPLYKETLPPLPGSVPCLPSNPKSKHVNHPAATPSRKQRCRSGKSSASNLLFHASTEPMTASLSLADVWAWGTDGVGRLQVQRQKESCSTHRIQRIAEYVYEKPLACRG